MSWAIANFKHHAVLARGAVSVLAAAWRESATLLFRMTRSI